MSQIYETRLKKEFLLLQKLQKHSSVKDIVEIFYIDRMRGGAYKSVLEDPGNAYPYQFKVSYKMPMYVSETQLKRDWSASFIFETPEEILMNENSSLGVKIEGNDNRFTDGNVPFNNHVGMGYVCTGTCWGVANQGFGIWYFIITLGALFNLDKFIMAVDDDAESSHINPSAFRFWRDVRRMQPTNNINWPTKLMDEVNIGESIKNNASSNIKIGAKIEEKKASFIIGEKQVEEKKPSKFIIGSKI